MNPLNPVFFGAFLFFWGSCWGSFLNVLIHRIPLDQSIVFPPSTCPSCQTRLKWYWNIPLISYLALRGRCGQCGVAISSRYFWVELIGGVWSLALGWILIWPEWSQPEVWVVHPHELMMSVLYWLWLQSGVYALVALTFIDLEHFFLPDEITFPMIAIGCWGGMALPQNDPLNHFWGMVAGWGLIVGLRGLGWLMYRREAMGMGDAKLLALIGAFLGWRMLPFILLASAVQALVAILGAQLYTRFTGRSNALTVSTEELDAYFGEEDMYADAGSHIAIPFGPFLALAAFEVIVFGPTVILEQFYSFLYVV